MIPAAFEYVVPRAIPEALARLRVLDLEHGVAVIFGAEDDAENLNRG